MDPVWGHVRDMQTTNYYKMHEHAEISTMLYQIQCTGMAICQNLGRCDRQQLYMGVWQVLDVCDPTVGTSVSFVMLLYG